LIRIGYELVYRFPQDTAVILMLNTHFSRASDMVVPDVLKTAPDVPLRPYRDSFGNWCTRLLAPAGSLRIFSSGVVRDTGLPDIVVKDAQQNDVDSLPEEALMFLLGSRYCEVDLMTNTAWKLFGDVKPGWTRVQAICDYVNSHITFGYHNARPTRTASEAYTEGVGVCRDFAHLAVTFCRCMNIPARYCTGYLGDIGVPVTGPMDWAAWFEAYIGGQWHIFDPRNNVSRIGRILMARGRDAADVAISTTFGPSILDQFTVICDEVTSVEQATGAAAASVAGNSSPMAQG
jgi:transglutaminase-like putative cysteine protease